MNQEKVKEQVRERYASAAEGVGCCSTAAKVVASSVGYDAEQLSSIPEGSNLGLGCGNPVAHAMIREGDTVLDLGSGAGLDCFLAAKHAGPNGRVIGVDMTPAMLEKARANAERGGYTNVEFRQGEIESLPIEDNSIDLVISNCVINLSPDKPSVFREIFRVLKPGGRFVLSDIVLASPLPDSILEHPAAYSACVAGALLKQDYLATIRAAGFNEVLVQKEQTYPLDLLANDPNVMDLQSRLKDVPQADIAAAADAIRSVNIEGRKSFGPGVACCGGEC